MRRVIYWLVAALTFGFFGGPLPANAAAFLAINGGTWTYSAAAAGCPAGVAYYWGLSIGAGSVSYAYAYCFSAPGKSAAYAIARAGFGWRGAWYATGFADPQADLGIDIPDISDSLSTLVNSQDSTDLGNDVASDAAAAASLASPGYTLDYDTNGEIDGITFTSGDNDSSSETNAVDELALIVVNSSAENDFCSAIGDSGCAAESAQTNAGGDVTDIAGVIGDLGSSALATEMDLDPTNLASGGTFSFADIAGTNTDSQVILVAEGDPVPEPASLLLFAQGLLALGLFRRRRASVNPAQAACSP